MRRVVVTGVGTVGVLGAGVEALADGLRAGATPRSEIDRSGGHHVASGARSAAVASGVDLSTWVKPAAARRMSTPSKLAVAATRMAIQNAGLTGTTAGWADTAIVMSTSFGPADYTERLFLALTREGPETSSPSLFTESVANAPAAQMAIECGATGANITVTQREAGPVMALARAADEIRSGRSPRALAGAVDEMTPLLHALLDRLGVLARDKGAGEVARPFDRDRNGLIAGEGASVLVLEDEEEARARGATVLVAIGPTGSAFDPTASRVGWGHGHEGLATALRAVVARGGLRLEQIDLICSGATGSVGGDRIEALTLLRAFGDAPLPPVLAPKAVTGEYGGGHIAAGALAAAGRLSWPTPGFREVDPLLGIRPHDGSAIAPPRRTLLTAFAAGGAAAFAVLERP